MVGVEAIRCYYHKFLSRSFNCFYIFRQNYIPAAHLITVETSQTVENQQSNIPLALV